MTDQRRIVARVFFRGAPVEVFAIEENLMLGFRGASRYYSPEYRDGFALECRAILREEMGFRKSW